MRKTESAANTTFFKSVIKGVIVSIAIVMASVILLSWLLHNEFIELESLDYSVMIGMLIAMGVGCFCAVMTFRKQMILLSLCTSTTVLLILICITAVFFEGQYRGVPVTWLLGMGCGFAVALVAVKILNKPNSYRNKRKW